MEKPFKHIANPEAKGDADLSACVMPIKSTTRGEFEEMYPQRPTVEG